MRGWDAEETQSLNQRFDLTVRLKNNTVIPAELSLTAQQFDGSWNFTAFIADISERRHAEDELRVAAVAFASENGMVITDAKGIILRVNPAFMRLTGYSAEDTLGQRISLLSSGRHDRTFYKRMWESLRGKGSWQGEIWNKRKDCSIYAEMLTITAVNLPNGETTHYVGSFMDITESKDAEAKIHRLSFYDTLTRLPNRSLLQDRLGQAITASERSKLFGAIFYLDLDKFKEINDTHGHDQGDLLLIEVSKRLQRVVRESDTVARLGGDEFVLLLENLGKTELEAAGQAEIVGGKLLLALNEDRQLGNFEHRCTASIGITLFGPKHDSVEETLKRADLAMYKSKANGRNTLHFFDPEMQTAITTRIALEAGLREALANELLTLHYQPQVNEQFEVSGAEVLVRWMHPVRGMVPPAEFIPLAEETGLILPLGLWVLGAACAQLTLWASQPSLAQLTLAVNVSARQFHQSDFVDQVLDVLRRTAANPKLLKLELTESMMVSDMEDIIKKMEVLKAHGVGFSLDDFGTGYSSLAYLSRLPLDQLKIDRSFVMEIESSANAVVICAATIGLAHNLNLKVVAEGVETEAQRYFLSTLHRCDFIQGYLFSRPLPIETFNAFVQRPVVAF